MRDALRHAGEILARNDSDVMARTEIQGIQNFGESGLRIRTRTKVKPGCHAQVGRDYRTLIKETFGEKGIEIPFARRVLLFEKGNIESLQECLHLNFSPSPKTDKQ